MAGVSVGTVDRVLHGRGKVSEEAERKVQEVLEKTGYQPNLLARTLGSNKNIKIIALIPDPSVDNYWAQTSRGLDNAISEWGQYNIEVEQITFDLYDKNDFEKQAQEALAKNPSGVLIAPVFHHESLKIFLELKKHNIPYVLFNNNIPESEPLSFIGQNLYQSGSLAAELLDWGAPKGSKVAILHLLEDVANSVHLISKELGFINYYKSQSGKDIEVISYNLNEQKVERLEEELYELLTSQKLYGVFISTSKGTSIASRVVKKSSSKIRIVGYDLLDLNVKGLEEGTVDFLINQNPKRQAQQGISHLANYLLLKKDPPREDLFPLEIITRQNLQSYKASSIH